MTNTHTTDTLQRISALFASGARHLPKVEAVDQARAEGATWQQIADAMGHGDRGYAQSWRKLLRQHAHAQ